MARGISRGCLELPRASADGEVSPADPSAFADAGETLPEALRVLRSLQGMGLCLSPAAIALRAGLPKARVCLLLSALETVGFVDRLPLSRRVRLGASLLRLSAAAEDFNVSTATAGLDGQALGSAPSE